MSRQLADFLDGPVEAVAPRLLGCRLERELDGRLLSGRIVETEAYAQTDAASHSYKGQTPRTDVMFGPAGRLYVYFTYGMHYCLNVVTGPAGQGSAVLIRALEPLAGEDIMRSNRKDRPDLTDGPAKLCQALAIDRTWNGHDLSEPPFRLVIEPPVAPERIARTARVGISRARDVPWRFYLKDSSHVSRPAVLR